MTAALLCCRSPFADDSKSIMQRGQVDGVLSCVFARGKNAVIIILDDVDLPVFTTPSRPEFFHATVSRVAALAC